MITRIYLVAGIALLLAGCSHKKTTTVEPSPSKTMAQTQDSRCVNDFFVLRTMKDATYKNYRSQFDTLNGSYQVYQVTAPKLDKDQKELFSMALDSKLIVLCARVKYSSFTNVKGVVKQIDAL